MFYEQEEAKNINLYLKTLNKVPLRPNMSLFRLVWSDNERELRKGEFNEFYGSIFIRTFKGTKLVPKYPWLKGRWVLEQWYPPALAFNEELPDSRNGGYEPIYVFEDAKFNALPLRIDVVKLVIHHINKPSRSETARKNSDANASEDKENHQYKRDLDVLNDESYLVSQLHTGSAGLVPKTFGVDSPNLRGKK